MPQHFHLRFRAWPVPRIPLVRARVVVTDAMVAIESRAFAALLSPPATDSNAFE
jgi:hypothetical protein